MTELTSLIAKYITRDTHKGSVNRIRQLMEADFEALIDKRVRDELQEALSLWTAGETKQYMLDRVKALSAKHSSKEEKDV